MTCQSVCAYTDALASSSARNLACSSLSRTSRSLPMWVTTKSTRCPVILIVAVMAGANSPVTQTLFQLHVRNHTTITHKGFWLLTSESRCKRKWRPFPQQCVGDWRKDEVQWIALALVGDRKLQNLYIRYPSWNALSLHSSSFSS